MSISLSEAIAKIEKADAGAMRRAQARQRNLTKPPGSLGRLEDVSIQLAGIFQTERPSIGAKAVIVAAGDHGVVAQGVTGYPQEVTAQMVLNFLAGGAAVSVMSRRLGVRQIIVDAGVAGDIPPHPDLRVVKIGRGTNDMTLGPAMTREQAEEAVLAGVQLAVEAAESGADLIAT
ncbi:MAG: nicotinate-nucleotide--dimethylbenzimidazole phosphoribosyltransferase, partial [Chloroflexi bacterium]|nr:nicotinate-nucleotide--dimethylbenzimidazole phosphoribosyltransferase [Chloroflexota bacterium]